MMIAYFFFFLITVCIGRSEEDGCFERYKSCADLISNMKDAPPCRIASAFMKCLVDTTEQCFPSFRDTVEKYRILVDEGCQPESTFFDNVDETMECLDNETGPFQSCELEGEFDDAAEICSSVSTLIKCVRLRTKIVCGKKSENTLYKLLRPIEDLLDDCKTSQDAKDVKINECLKELLKCDRGILTTLEYPCTDVERISNCYYDVVEKDCGISKESHIMKVVRKYVDQIPDYCNSESAFMQSFEKSSSCILMNYDVLERCNERYQDALSKDTLSQEFDFEGDYEPNEYLIPIARAIVEFRDCCAEKLRTSCGEEAAFVARFLLDPLAAVADDTCLEATGEKCSGAVRVHGTFLLLILSLKYILTEED